MSSKISILLLIVLCSLVYNVCNCQESELGESQLVKNCGQVQNDIATRRRRSAHSFMGRFDTPWSEEKKSYITVDYLIFFLHRKVAILEETKNDGYQYRYGGSLISENFIVTGMTIVCDYDFDGYVNVLS